MKIRINDISEKETVLPDERPVTDFPELDDLQASGECVFTAPLSSRLQVVREYDHIRVSGTVVTSVDLSCSRCLNRFPADIESHFTIFYTKATATEMDDEVELSEEDLVSAAYSGDEIDFTEQVIEQLLLELPVKPLCSPDCRGLCPSCGTDLNIKQCTCQEQPAGLIFSALRDFKVKQ